MDYSILLLDEGPREPPVGGVLRVLREMPEGEYELGEIEENYTSIFGKSPGRPPINSAVNWLEAKGYVEIRRSERLNHPEKYVRLTERAGA
jgi:DNA-binding PadR family transcriptional regulator